MKYSDNGHRLALRPWRGAAIFDWSHGPAFSESLHFDGAAILDLLVLVLVEAPHEICGSPQKNACIDSSWLRRRISQWRRWGRRDSLGSASATFDYYVVV